MKLIDKKTVIITRAGLGIGRAAAKLFAEHGANVVIAERDAGAGEACASESRARRKRRVRRHQRD